MSPPATTPRESRSKLVVLTVFGFVVVSGVVLAAAIQFPVSRPGPEFQTRALLDRLFEMLVVEDGLREELADPQAFRTERQRQGGQAAAVNVGSEMLHRVFAKREWVEGLPFFREANTDQDARPSGVGTAEAMEIADAWGSPIIVVFREWLGALASSSVAYVNGYGEPWDAAVPDLGDASFVLISMGDDGEPATEDDIVVYGRHP